MFSHGSGVSGRATTYSCASSSKCPYGLLMAAPRTRIGAPVLRYGRPAAGRRYVIRGLMQAARSLRSVKTRHEARPTTDLERHCSRYRREAPNGAKTFLQSRVDRVTEVHSRCEHRLRDSVECSAVIGSPVRASLRRAAGR